jgi:hypothetical protein
MEELSYKIVKMIGSRDEVVVRSSNYEVCKAAFEKALFVWRTEQLESEAGARGLFESEAPTMIDECGELEA